MFLLDLSYRFISRDVDIRNIEIIQQLPTRYNYNGERAGVQAILMPFKKGNGPDLATVMALKLNLTWQGSANLKSLLTTITMNKDV